MSEEKLATMKEVFNRLSRILENANDVYEVADLVQIYADDIYLDYIEKETT